MPCYRPLTAYQTAAGAVVFSELRRHNVIKQLQLPCQQCIGCRLERSRQWATRIMHHAQLHEHNSFLTLTYSAEKLKSQSLRHEDFQKFIRSFRKPIRKSLLRLKTNGNQPETEIATSKPISYYMTGEYGTRNRRPHFHACLFGHEFKDKTFYRTTESGFTLWESQQLYKHWKHGYANIGDLTWESAAYAARYICDKITGPNANRYYEHINYETGEIEDLKPEYNKMSLKPAIGKEWLQQYGMDIYPEGKALVRGHKSTAPKYYDKQYKRMEPDKYEEMKMKRELQALEYTKDNTPERLQAKERVKTAQINQLLRRI